MKASGTHEQIQIEDNATGFGMEKLFSRFMTEFLTEIEIEDPYIRSHHQVIMIEIVIVSQYFSTYLSLLLHVHIFVHVCGNQNIYF